MSNDPAKQPSQGNYSKSWSRKSQHGYYGDRLKMNAVPNRGTAAHSLESHDAPHADFWASAGIGASPASGLGMGVPSLFKGGKGRSGSTPKALDWGETDLEDDFHDLNVNVKASSAGSALVDIVAPLHSNKSREKMPAFSELALAPEWMQTATTFESDLSAEDTLVALEAAFEKCATTGKVEFESKVSKTKIAGTVLLPERAHFIVKFYRGKSTGTEDSNVVVEFQRRSGCARAFRAFYHDTLDILGGMGNWCKEWQPRPYGMHSFVEPAVEVDFDGAELEGDVGNWSDTVSTLITMASLELEDVQLDALSALQTLSKHAESKERLADLLTPTVQEHLLASPNEEVVILAKKIFTNVGIGF